MWVRLGLLLAICLLPGGGAEMEGEGARCKLPPDWKIGEAEPMKEAMGKVTVVALLQASWFFCLVQASRLDRLRLKLEGQGLQNVTYMVVNHQGEQSQRLHSLLAQKVSESIALYQQTAEQPDVWQALGGEKDDFLIYDRCGRLTYHISLPYSVLSSPYVEDAIRDTYCKRICGECTQELSEIPAECNRTDTKPDEEGENPSHGHSGHHHGHHGHGHGHGHSSHGDKAAEGQEQSRHRDRAAGHGGVSHGHREQQPHGGHHRTAEGRHDHLQHGQQQAADLAQVSQDVLGGLVMQKPEVAGRVRWKAKHSWQWLQGSDPHAAAFRWCWHWRQLFGEPGSEQPISLWHCDEALPASWQWQGLGDVTNHIRETWQWRPSPADWQLPRPAKWAWPLGVASWGWEQL